MSRHPPSSTLFPYTTLFRSGTRVGAATCQERRLSSPGVPVSRRLDPPARRHRHRSRSDACAEPAARTADEDRKSTRLNSSHLVISYAVFCLKKKTKLQYRNT